MSGPIRDWIVIGLYPRGFRDGLQSHWTGGDQRGWELLRNQLWAVHSQMALGEDSSVFSRKTHGLQLGETYVTGKAKFTAFQADLETQVNGMWLEGLEQKRGGHMASGHLLQSGSRETQGQGFRSEAGGTGAVCVGSSLGGQGVRCPLGHRERPMEVGTP